MFILSSAGAVKKNIYRGLLLTFLMLCVFEIRDIQHPDGVTGASRRGGTWPTPKPPQPPPEPYIKPKLPVKHKAAPKPVPTKTTEVLTSTPSAVTAQPPKAPVYQPAKESAPPQPTQESPSQVPSQPNTTDQRYHWRTQGKVGFVTEKNLDPGFLQEVTMWSENGEEIDFMVVEGTRFMEKDGTDSETKLLAVHDQIFLIYDVYLFGGQNRKNVAVVIKKQ